MFLKWGESRKCPGVGGWGGLGGCAHLSGGVQCRLSTPAFAPGSSEVAVGFFGLFVSFCP